MALAFERNLDGLKNHEPKKRKKREIKLKEIPEAEMILEPEEENRYEGFHKLIQDTSESDGILEKIEKHPEVKKAFEQWKDVSEDVIGNSISKEEAIQFLEWAMDNKKIDFSEYDDAWELYLKLNAHNASQKSYNVDQQSIKRISDTIASLPDKAERFTPTEDNRKLALYRQRLEEVHGILLNDEGNPASQSDEDKVSKMMGLVDADVKKIQRSGILGKIKGFVSDLVVSDQDRLQARAFQNDFNEYNRLSKEVSASRYNPSDFKETDDVEIKEVKSKKINKTKLTTKHTKRSRKKTV